MHQMNDENQNQVTKTKFFVFLVSFFQATPDFVKLAFGSFGSVHLNQLNWVMRQEEVSHEEPVHRVDLHTALVPGKDDNSY